MHAIKSEASAKKARRKREVAQETNATIRFVAETTLAAKRKDTRRETTRPRCVKLRTFTTRRKERVK
jgi:hypothetical protein